MQLAKMEAQRDLSQIIVHVDMDAFYASVELLDDPSLGDKTFAVGHGVISTASYAARKHGVRSGMAGTPSAPMAAWKAYCSYPCRVHRQETLSSTCRDTLSLFALHGDLEAGYEHLPAVRPHDVRCRM